MLKGNSVKLRGEKMAATPWLFPWVDEGRGEGGQRAHLLPTATCAVKGSPAVLLLPCPVTFTPSKP